MNRTTTANGPAAPAVETQAEPSLLDRVVEATQTHRFSVAEIETMAKQVGKSGFGFNEAQAFTLMMLCEADGLHPIHALRRYDINEFGKYTMKYTAMLAEMVRLGWEVKLLTDPNNIEYQEFSFAHPTKPVVVERMAFGVNEAKTAGLMGKKNYQGYAADMFRARAISRACRLNEPGIVSGVYTPEEAAEFDSRPSPRPLPADAPASRPEPAATTPEAPAPQPAPSSDCGRWIQTRVDEVNAEWAGICGKAKRDYKKLCNRFQCVNGIITSWLESDPPMLYPEAVETGSKRDNAKVAAVLKEMWESEEQGDVQIAVNSYLGLKLEEAAKAAGINLDSEPEEVPT